MTRTLELEKLKGAELKRALVELYDRLAKGKATLPDVVRLMALEPNRRRRLALYDEVARIADAENDETWTAGTLELQKRKTAENRTRAFRKYTENVSDQEKGQDQECFADHL